MELQKVKNQCKIRNVVEIPLRKHIGSFYSFHHLVDGEEHVAIGFPGEKRGTPLVRIHSECLTGDVFGSGRCDCGEQLDESIDLIAKHGGFVLYMRQEGRGIGLYNKLDAYELQLMGLDTYEANRKLQLDNDLRDYESAAQMLQALGANEIELMSNNPDKAAQLEAYGIKIKSVKNTSVFLKDTNVRYLEAKVEKTGHQIDISYKATGTACNRQ